MPTIADFFELRRPNVQRLSASSNGRATGIEIEVEGIPEGEEHTPKGWTHTEDGSLRYNGCEYVSRPTYRSDVPELLGRLFDAMPESRTFSMRTSTHVHVDCTDLSWNQVWGITLFYSLIEPFMYEWVGRSRKHNIFCVPLNAATLGRRGQTLRMMSQDWERPIAWSKYMGYNMVCLGEHGTVEFRQMSGTNDVSRIVQWVEMCHTVVQVGQTFGVDGLSTLLHRINTVEDWWGIIDQTFGKQVTVRVANEDILRAILVTKSHMSKAATLPRLTTSQINDFVSQFGGAL